MEGKKVWEFFCFFVFPPLENENLYQPGKQMYTRLLLGCPYQPIYLFLRRNQLRNKEKENEKKKKLE